MESQGNISETQKNSKIFKYPCLRWPLISQDLTLSHFSLSHLKEKVYFGKVKTLEHLKQNI